MKFENPLSSIETLPQFLAALVEIVVQIAIPVIVIAIVYTGFLFVSARGNEEQLQKARTAFLYVIIGAAIILGAQVLAEAIQGTIGAL